MKCVNQEMLPFHLGEDETELGRILIKQLLQEIMLCGMYRGGVFREAAMYGGTALRIFTD